MKRLNVLLFIGSWLLGAIGFGSDLNQVREEYPTAGLQSHEFFDEQMLLEEPLETEKVLDNFDYVYVKNKCYNDIYFAHHSVDQDGIWVTKGWYKVPAYGTKYVIKTRNRYIYWYAESANGAHIWSGADWYGSIRGQGNYGFRMYDLGPVWGDQYLHITCN